MDIERRLLAPSGLIPNNPAVALAIYRNTLVLPETQADEALIQHFAVHGWVDAWVNGIYDYQHYHATAHEVLGIAQGWARVQLGGAHGPVWTFSKGDVVMIPAGVGHCREAMSDDLVVVGAYPRGQTADLRRETVQDFRDAAATILRVPLPEQDPVTGEPFQAAAH